MQANQETPVIMINSSSIIFALAFALLLNSFLLSATLALPASRIKDDTATQDSFSSVKDEDVTGPGDFSPRRFPLVEGRLADEDGTKRIFILSVSIASEGIAQYVRKMGFLKGFWMAKAVSFVKGVLLGTYPEIKTICCGVLGRTINS